MIKAFGWIFSLHDVNNNTHSIDLNASGEPAVHACGTFLRMSLTLPDGEQGMVEPDGIEPTTSCLQSRRSPS